MNGQTNIVCENTFFAAFSAWGIAVYHIGNLSKKLKFPKILKTMDVCCVIRIYLVKDQITVRKSTCMNWHNQASGFEACRLTDIFVKKGDSRKNNIAVFYYILRCVAVNVFDLLRGELRNLGYKYYALIRRQFHGG